MKWLKELCAWVLGLLAFREITLQGERQRRRADDAEAALDTSQRADKAAAGYDALSDAERLQYREKHGVYRD
ncbi:hypothetical protein [Methylorubrum sp. SB2]|uniref:hypothetical protein n=1 Tax=Methylorubrum subtropicum TaxID=3138812 RepID=UPI00313D42E4